MNLNLKTGIILFAVVVFTLKFRDRLIDSLDELPVVGNLVK